MLYASTPVRTVAPAVTPVSVSEAKAHCRYDDTDQDALFSALVDAATAYLDGWAGVLGRCLVTQTWRADFSGFPCGGLRLPFPNVTSVTVAYKDTAGADQTLSSSVYHLVNDAGGSALVLAYEQSWPSVATRPDAVKVTLTAGYGAAADVPAAIRQAMLLMIGDWFRNRETGAVGARSGEIPMAAPAKALLAPFARRSL